MSIADEFAEKLNSLPSYEIEIGVISADTNRKEKVRVGVTNAELMFIHENGSPLQHIPARPVLQMTIDYTNKNLLDNKENVNITNNDLLLTAKIVLAHLKEFPNYYNKYYGLTVFEEYLKSRLN